MGAAVSLSTFGGTATPPTNFATPTGKSALAEAAGVATPTTYAADCAMVYTGATYANGRFQIQIKNEFKSAVTLLFKLASSSDLTADHGEIVFTPGSAVAPAWEVPDTITIKKRVSGTTTTITPTNTPSGGVDHPAIVGNTISLRHHRIAADDVLEVDPVDNQVLVRLNHDVFAHEEVTGLPSSTEYVGLISHSGSATTQAYDNARGGALVGRYVEKATGNDSNSGLSGSPWLTLGKGTKAQAAGEIVFVNGAFTEFVATYSLSPAPRTATGWEDPIWLVRKAGGTFTNFPGAAVFHSIAPFNYWYFVNCTVGNTGNGSDPAVKIRQSTKCRWIGGALLGCADNAFQITSESGSGFDGDSLMRDTLVHGNGRRTTGGAYHQLYTETQNMIIEYCDIDGTPYSTFGKSTGWGVNIFTGANTLSTNTSGSKVLYCRVHDHTGTPFVAGIILARGTGCQAIGNRIYNNSQGIQTDYNAVDSLIQSNVIFDNTQGVVIGGLYTTTDTKVLQNTIANNTTYGIRNRTTSTGAVRKNNIIVNNGTDVQADAAITETTDWETGDGAPGFVDQTGRDYTLASGASAATGATDISGDGVTFDYYGYAIPQGATPAFGAYEFPDPATNPLVSVANVMGEVNVEITLSISVIGQGNDGRRMRLTRSSTDITVNAPASGSVTVKGGN